MGFIFSIVEDINQKENEEKQRKLREEEDLKKKEESDVKMKEEQKKKDEDAKIMQSRLDKMTEEVECGICYVLQY